MKCAKLKVTIDSRDSKLSWIALTASVLLMFSSFGFMRMFGIFYSVFLKEFKSSKEKTAWVGSIPVSLVFILSPLAMWLHERYGLRRCTTLSVIPLSASLLMTSFSRNIDQTFVTYSVPFGLASCVMIMGTHKAAYRYFDKRLSTATAIQTGGCSIAEIGLSYLISFLLTKVELERTLQILAVVFLFIGLTSSRLFFSTNYQNEEQPSWKSKGYQVYFKLLKNKPFGFFLFAMAILSFTYSVSSVHQVQLAIEYGASESLARQFPVFTAVSGCIGRLTAGVVADSKIVNIVSYFQCILFLIGTISIIAAFSYTKTHVLVYVWVYAFIEGQVNVTVTPITRDLVGLTYLSEGISLLLAVIAVPVVLGPPLIGFLADITQDYKVFFYVAGVPPLLATFALIIVRYMISEEDKQRKQDAKTINIEEDNKDSEVDYAAQILLKETIL
ncbi:monocarboxylate transporter 10-like [Rhopilema esculentum]|uniref:monocarboxylate transporter 10-like n=1 Tax=Rhopilema esculentum TaxID=499914 RepID=UPI0031DBAE72|eukprot:gene6866-12465_t